MSENIINIKFRKTAEEEEEELRQRLIDELAKRVQSSPNEARILAETYVKLAQALRLCEKEFNDMGLMYVVHEWSGETVITPFKDCPQLITARKLIGRVAGLVD